MNLRQFKEHVQSIMTQLGALKGADSKIVMGYSTDKSMSARIFWSAPDVKPGQAPRPEAGNARCVTLEGSPKGKVISISFQPDMKALLAKPVTMHFDDEMMVNVARHAYAFLEHGNSLQIT